MGLLTNFHPSPPPHTNICFLFFLVSFLSLFLFLLYVESSYKKGDKKNTKLNSTTNNKLHQSSHAHIPCYFSYFKISKLPLVPKNKTTNKTKKAKVENLHPNQNTPNQKKRFLIRLSITQSQTFNHTTKSEFYNIFLFIKTFQCCSYHSKICLLLLYNSPFF